MYTCLGWQQCSGAYPLVAEPDTFAKTLILSRPVGARERRAHSLPILMAQFNTDIL